MIKTIFALVGPAASGKTNMISLFQVALISEPQKIHQNHSGIDPVAWLKDLKFGDLIAPGLYLFIILLVLIALAIVLAPLIILVVTNKDADHALGDDTDEATR